MIARLTGRLVHKTVTSSVVDVGGVGYLVSHSLYTFESLPAVGERVELLTHLYVREDALQLYAFVEAEERRLFELLLAVSGVGPKMALAVLSGLTPEALSRAVADENLVALTSTPGIGRKTAERILIELRGKVVAVAGAGAGVAGSAAGGVEGQARAHPQMPGLPGRTFDDAVSALVALGLTRPSAIEAVRRAAEGGPAETVEDLVRRALAASGSRGGRARSET